MVGVAGKSKGCITCRKRKVGCDQQVPSCKKCTQSGWLCEGYDKFPIFINRSLRGLEKRAPLEEAKPRSLSKPQSLLKPQSLPKPHQAVPLNRKRTPQYAVNIPMQINNSAIIEQMWTAVFVENYIPSKSDTSATSRFWPNAWFAEAFALTTDKGITLELSLRAVCMTRVGWLTNDQALVRHGQRIYGRALRELQAALRDEDRMWSDETLAAGAALQFYELYEITSQTIISWNNHVSGLSHLLQLRGPDRHYSRLARAILEMNRYNSMIQSVQFRKSSFWCSAEWQTRPWLGGDTKDLFQKLCDKGFAIAGVIESFEWLERSDGAERTQILLDLLDRCLAIDRDFALWYAELAATYPAPMYWARTPSALEKPPEHLNDATDWGREHPAIEFASPELALQLMTYWALQVLLNMRASSIGKALKVETTKHLQTPSPSASAASAAASSASAASLTPASTLVNDLDLNLNLPLVFDFDFDFNPDFEFNRNTNINTNTNANTTTQDNPTSSLALDKTWSPLSSPLLRRATDAMEKYSRPRAIALATRILRSMPYITASARGISGPQSSIFALRIAMAVCTLPGSVEAEAFRQQREAESSSGSGSRSQFQSESESESEYNQPPATSTADVNVEVDTKAELRLCKLWMAQLSAGNGIGFAREIAKVAVPWCPIAGGCF